MTDSEAIIQEKLTSLNILKVKNLGYRKSRQSSLGMH